MTRQAMAAAVAVFLAMAGPAAAQDYPTKPIKLVVPFAAGGSTDIVARITAQKMSESIGQQVIVENRTGAGGNVGANSVAKSPPDGYTILMATISTHALNSALFEKMPYDPIKDFEPISLLAVVPNVLVVHPSVPAKTVGELIALLKKNPGTYDYASSGIGTPLHLSGELFKSMANVEMTHIPYRGSGPALNDVIAGQVKVMFDNLPSSIGHIKQGTLRGLAVTTRERSPAAPDLPTMAEAGLPGYETYTWNALFAPAKTPKPIVDRLAAESRKAVADPGVKTRLAELSAVAVGSDPATLGKHVEAELAKWAPIVKASGAKATE